MSIATEIQRLQSAKADIKSAIENKGVTVGDGTIDTYAQKISEISSGGSGDYNQGYEDGKNSVVKLEKFVKSLQLTSLSVLGTSEVVLNLDSATELARFAYITNEANKNTVVEKLTINCPNQITSMNMAFYCNGANWYDQKLKHITLNFDTSKNTSYSQTFTGLIELEVIDGQPLDFSSIANASYMSAFANVAKLIEVRVVKNTIKFNFNISKSPNLSTDTIQSIIDGLADLTGGTAQTLTVHKTVGEKLTDTQKATITAKNWELVY